MEIAGTHLKSRLLLGTAQYPSPEILKKAIAAAGVGVVTVSLRRQTSGRGGHDFWSIIRDLGVTLLPNTAHCRTAAEAVKTARMARELFETTWVKLEVIGDEHTLHPDVHELVVAARMLVEEGFTVFPYSTDDLVVAQRLVDAGCKIVMPWAAPIGSLQGPVNMRALERLRARLPDTTLIVDAGIGKPSHAACVMELGYDAVLLNSAVASAHDPVDMARAFSRAVEAGRLAYAAGLAPERACAMASTPVIGVPFGSASVTFHRRSTESNSSSAGGAIQARHE